MSPYKLLLPIVLTIATLLAPLLLCAELRADQQCADQPCGKVCEASIVEVTEEKSQWRVGCKEICVPRVVCPWAEGGSGITTFNFMKNTISTGGCDDPECFENLPTDCVYCETPRQGDVRRVRTLESEPYETRRCVTQWNTANHCMGCDVCPGSSPNAYEPSAPHRGIETIEVPTEAPTETRAANATPVMPAPQAGTIKFWEFWK